MNFRRITDFDKWQLQQLTEAVRKYLEEIEKPIGGRHRKTTLVFTGDRYRPVDIVSRWVVPHGKRQQQEATNQESENINQPNNESK